MLVAERTLKFVVLPLCLSAVLLAAYFRDSLTLASRFRTSRPSNAPFSSPFDHLDNDIPSHQFHADGLLVVNPNAPHPILELIDRAEARWESKLNRASKTLPEAVVEYQRRYNRAPPKGFDAWWQYVQEHDVQLPDEYDQIWRDLEPFWGLNPTELRTLQSEEEEWPDSYTLGKNDTSRITIVHTTISDQERLLGGAHQLIDLLEDVQHLIPPFRAVFSPHDNPSLLSDYDVKNMTLEAAATKTYVNISDLPEVSSLGWLSACPPSSPARQTQIDLDNPPPPPPNKTFIFNHRTSMDPCLHPNLFYQHGQFVAHGPGPTPQRLMTPRFAYSATMLHHEIQPPTPINWVDDILPRSDDPEWNDRIDERLSWRGRNTGLWFGPSTRWEVTQRPRLVAWANNLNGTADVLISPEDDTGKVGHGVKIPKSKMNPALFDIAFAGAPIDCTPETCEKLTKVFDWRRIQIAREAGNHKYIVDVDGNAWSSRFKRLMTSNALIFKSTIYPEWFLDRVEPWAHYVPVQVDLSDLYDALVFFRGAMYGEGAHDDLAQKIATAGRVWSKSFWRKEDLTAYMFRLLLEYIRVMSPDRETMSYVDDMR